MSNQRTVIIEIPHDWQGDLQNCGERDNFRAMLFRLIMKADPENLEALREGFPVEVAYYEGWMKSNPEEFPRELEFDHSVRVSL
jgi:hypothetical protein